jgi:hypothetical protein
MTRPAQKQEVTASIGAIALAGTLSIAAACTAHDDDPAGPGAFGGGGGTLMAGGPADAGPPPDLVCSTDICTGGRVEVRGFPFVKAAMFVTDGTGLTTAHIRVSDAGAICMSGSIIDFASLGFWLAQSPPLPPSEGENVVPLDLVGLKITTMRVETAAARPFRSGLGLTFVRDFPPGACPPEFITPGLDGGIPGCGRPAFFRHQDSINETGVTMVRLDEFGSDPPLTIEQGVNFLFFDIVEFKAGYDLCIQSLTFLDEMDRDVSPPDGTGDTGGH